MFWLEPMVEAASEHGRFAYGPVKASDVASLFDAGFLTRSDHPLSLGDRRAARKFGAGNGHARTFQGHDLRLLRRRLFVQGGDAGRQKAPEGTPVAHVDGFVRGKGKFIRTEYVATDEKAGPRFPLFLTTGRIH